MDRRYQVFVSSTYADLIEERNEIMQALLELECMPAGMELFPAANETQWNWIKKVIDESDYYIVIIAGRYGSVSKDTGLSYTEMEYRYAPERNKPTIGFLHEDPSRLPAKSVEPAGPRAKKLEGFRELVKSKLCKFYSSPADLGAKVSRSITQLKKQYPTRGWIRADILESLASSDEVLKLKKENEELKTKLYNLGLERPETANHLASGAESFEVPFRFSRQSPDPETGRFLKTTEEWSTIFLSWDEMFKTLGTSLLKNQAYSWNPESIIAKLAGKKAYAELEVRYPQEKFSSFRISPECLDTIMIQFRALKLFLIADRGGWELTPYGDNYLTSLLGVPKGKTQAGG